VIVKESKFLRTPRSSLGNMSNEMRNSPISDDKSIKNIEQNLSEQKLKITQLQEKLDKEAENRQHQGTNINFIYKFRVPNS
jgi:predicted RNase H-like nuclease (RuvC/YqgF family)